MSEAAVRRGLRKVQYLPYLVPAVVIRKLDIALEQPIKLDVQKDGAGAITSDWHHPITDYSLVNTFIDRAREVDATNWLVVAGDWFNIDALSAFDSKQDDANLVREIYGSTQTMVRLLETFDKIYLSWGNHDSRVHKSLGYKVPFTTAMRFMFSDLDPGLFEDRIILSNLDHIVIETPRGPYHVSHPKNYNSVPLTTARKLASKNLMHSVTGHSHHTAVGFDVSGRFVCAESGGFFDAKKVAYLQRTTTFANWQPGWSFLDRDGFLCVESPEWTNSVGRGRL